MKCVLVSHSHWDREWYRTFQSFRARLVDLIDRVLELVAEDPGFRFLLDGQTVVIEDYLEIRPGRRADLEAACRAGRLAIGPWYVQPDSLLPSGEAHVRNLLEGRRVGAAVGPVSRVAYCPDSFGHPAQLPQLFHGFGLWPFIYWRGGGDEVEALPAAYLWTAPDGSAVLAHRLAEGYFAASGLPLDPAAAAHGLAEIARSRRAARRAHGEPAARRVVGTPAAQAPQPPDRGAPRGLGGALGRSRRGPRRTRRAARAACGLARSPPEPGARLDRRLLAGSGPRADAGAVRRGRGARERDGHPRARAHRRSRPRAPPPVGPGVRPGGL